MIEKSDLIVVVGFLLGLYVTAFAAGTLAGLAVLGFKLTSGG